MNTQVMIDLETLGNKPGSVLVALGAVKFNEQGVYSEFYERIDAESCTRLGLVMDPSTVMWWLKQNEAARLEITQPAKSLWQVLNNFSFWIGKEETDIWGNGASFDNAVLASAYDAAEMDRPWKFFNDRCYRTMKSLFPQVALDREGTHHHALDDARHQANHLLAILKGIAASA